MDGRFLVASRLAVLFESIAMGRRTASPEFPSYQEIIERIQKHSGKWITFIAEWSVAMANRWELRDPAVFGRVLVRTHVEADGAQQDLTQGRTALADPISLFARAVVLCKSAISFKFAMKSPDPLATPPLLANICSGLRT